MRVALLTGGGDCPGLNAVIYAAVRKGINHYGDEFIGFLNGWRGVLDNNFIPLTLENIDGIQLKGGTILHSSSLRQQPALADDDELIGGLRDLADQVAREFLFVSG